MINNNESEIDILRKADKRQQELATYEGDDRVISASEYQNEIALKNLAPVTTVMSGIAKLDDLLKGFQGGELVTISGPTKQGKTTLAHTFTRNFENQGVKSLWFSFEVTPAQLFAKFALAKEFYLPRQLKQKNVDWIRDRIQESKLKYETVAVFIDHLHYIVDLERMGGNSSLEIGSVVRKLKSLAVEENVVIFLMAHMTKTKYDEMPTEEGLRDSSFITQESDKTLIVWRERTRKKDPRTKSYVYDFSGKTLLIISNDRREGIMGKVVPLMFDNNELKPFESEYNEEYKKVTGEINPEDIPF